MRDPHRRNSDRVRAIRSLIILMLSGLLALGGLVIPSGPHAAAAPGDLAFGIIRSDAVRNQTVETTGAPGTVDKGIRGVAVTLRCSTPVDSNNPIVASTTTGADGSYRFSAATVTPIIATRCAPGSTVFVALDANGAAGDVLAAYDGITPNTANAFDAVGSGGDSAQRAQTAPFNPAAAATTPVELNGLLWPTWKTNLALAADPNGFGGQAVYTGTAPFDPTGGQAGTDSGANNDIVRSGDTVSYNWNLTVSAEQPLSNTVKSVVFEQVLTLAPGASANFSRIPADCVGTSPASSIVAQPSGTAVPAGTPPPAGTTSLTLTCNLGQLGTDTSAVLLPTTVRTFSSSANGSTFTTTARAYGVDATGLATAQPSQPVDNGPITITAAPRYDLSKIGSTYTRFGTQNVNGVPTQGVFFRYIMQVSTDRSTGVEAFTQPVTITEDFWGTNPLQNNSVMTGLKWYLVTCVPNDDGNVAGAVLGKRDVAGRSEVLKARSVMDSGTCTPSTRAAGDDTSPYQLTLKGIDTSGQWYPSRTLPSTGGSDLSAGPFYVASYRMEVFVPLTEVDGTDGDPTNQSGRFNANNQVTGFDPSSVTGTSNYGTGNEPGFCPDRPAGGAYAACDRMPATNARSNNVAGPSGVTISPGTFAKYWYDQGAAWTSTLDKPLPQAATSHDGQGQVQPGETHTSMIAVSNGGTPWTATGACDIFDNTTIRLAELRSGAMTNASSYPAGMYAFVHNSALPSNQAGQQPNQANYIVEYGHFDFGNDTANNGAYDATTGRFGGSWTNQAAVRCTDNATTWYADPGQVPGGIDAVNAVRVRSKPDAPVVDPGSNLRFYFAFKQRETFLGGPNNGQPIPAGTVVANYGQPMTSNIGPNWSWNSRSFIPQPDNGATDGDRYTITSFTANLKKRSVVVDGQGSGAADYGNTGTAIAGDPVIWEVSTSISANSATPGPVQNVVITDTLPRYVTYDAAKTASITGGTPADTAVVNADGTTTLTWNLGTWTPNKLMPPRRIYTVTDSLAPSNTSVTNKAEIRADGLIFNPGQHSDDHTVVLEQSGRLQLRKDVDQTLDLQDDNQAYVLNVKNFSANLSIANPTVIEVFSYNGDATNPARANRTPASKFVGTNQITGPVTATEFTGTGTSPGTVYYTKVPGAQVSQDLNDPTNDNTKNNTAGGVWFSADRFGALAGAPANFGEVTAFKFVADRALATGTGPASGLKLGYTLKQGANGPGNLYADRFTAFSPTLVNGTKFQVLTSNQTTVRVLGFSLGDLIWVDQNADGKHTAGTDRPAPAGVPVQVHRVDGTTDTVVATTTTDANGRWIVNDLARGDYYVTVPASAFASGGGLYRTEPSPVNSVADPNTDKNEDVDHNTTPFAGGMRSSGLIHLDATVNGSTITGQEPLGDNVANLPVSPLTTDAFTNLTLDLAVRPVPGYTFAKSAAPASGTAVAPDGTITYTLRGTNTGGAPLNVTIGDDLAQVLDNATLVPGSAKATIDGAAATAPGVNGTALSWTGVLQPGQVAVVTYQVKVNTSASTAQKPGTVLKNNATSSAVAPSRPDLPAFTGSGQTTHPVPGYRFTKTSDPATGTAVGPGRTVTYTLTGENTGATPLDTRITDDLAAVLDQAAITTAPRATIDGTDAATQPTVTGNTLSWQSALPAGATVRISYTVTLDARNAGSPINNSATSTAQPPNGLPPFSGTGRTEHPTPAFTLAKSATPESGRAVQRGDTITYHVTGTNTGGTVLDPVTVTDDLSKVLSDATLTGTPTASVNGAPAPAPSLSGTTLTWSGPLPVGAKVELTYTVTVSGAPNGVVLRNRATATAVPPAGADPITPPPVETQHPIAGFTLAKSNTPGDGRAVLPGDQITYTLLGRNTGATTLNTTITDDLSQVLNHAGLVGSPTVTVSGVAQVPPATVSGNRLTWSHDALPAGATVQISYTVKVNPDAAGATLVNRAGATATPPAGGPIPVDEVSTRNPVAGYTFTKTADPASGSPLSPGDTVRYTLTGTNTGATRLDPVTVTDQLAGILDDADLSGAPTATIVDADGNEAGSAAAPTIADGTLSWTGSLQPGQRVRIRYAATVKAGARGGVLQNQASSQAQGPDGVSISPPPVQTSHPIAGYGFAKTSDPASGATVLPGRTITYTLTGSNSGNVPLATVNIADDLTQVLNAASLTGTPTVRITTLSGAAVTDPAGAVTREGDLLSWSGALGIDRRVVISYTVTVADDAVGKVLTNRATSTAVPQGLPETPEQTGTVSHPVAGHELSKTSDPASGTSVAAGQQIGYTIVDRNTGATPLQGVRISDNLAAVLTGARISTAPTARILDAAGAEVPGAAPVVDGTVLTWNGALGIGQRVEIRYTVTVNDDGAGQVLTNTATSTATPPGSDPLPTTPQTVTHPVAGYQFSKEATPPSGTAVLAGEKVGYTLLGRNTGAVRLNAVTISDDLSGVLDDAELAGDPTATIVDAVTGEPVPGASAPAAVITGDRLVWNGPLETGQAVRIGYQVRVRADAAGGTLKNLAAATAVPDGGGTLPDSGPISTEHPVPGYTFAKTADPATGAPVQAGQRVGYTLTGTNTGATELRVTISDQLTDVLAHADLGAPPTAQIIDTASGQPVPGTTPPDPVVTDGVLTWAGTLARGQSAVIGYAVTVRSDAAGAVLKNSASSIGSPPGAATPITPPEVTTEHPVAGYRLTKTSDVAAGITLRPWDAIGYTVTGSNIGAAGLDPVTITDDLSGVTGIADLRGVPVATLTGPGSAGVPVPAPTVSGSTLSWHGALAPGQQVVLSYTFVVKADARTGDLVNRAQSTAQPVGGGLAIEPPPVTVTVGVQGASTQPPATTPPPTQPPGTQPPGTQPPAPGNPPGNPPTGALPATGAPPMALLLPALLMLIAGTGLVWRGRRRR